MRTKPRVYLAGPDVFHPEAARLGDAKKAMCAEFGFLGLFPLDNEIDPDAPDASGAIYAANAAMIAGADCGIFHLTPFRGPSADVGTVFELGMFIALGKPAFGYTNVVDDLVDRLHVAPGLVFDPASALRRDKERMSAEDFGNADNLMIDASLAAQGRKVHRVAAPPAERFVALEGFRACLVEAKALFDARRSPAA